MSARRTAAWDAVARASSAGAGVPTMRLALEVDPVTRLEAAGVSSVAALVRVMSDPNAPVRLQTAAVSLAHRSGDRQLVARVCAPAAESKSWEVRLFALQAMVATGTRGALTVTLRSVGDQHPEVREFATSWLAVVGNRRSLRARRTLERLVLDVEEPLALRRRAIEALGTFQGRAAERTLMQALADSDPDVRAEAAVSLGGFSSERVAHALLARAGDSSPVRVSPRIGFDPMTVGQVVVRSLKWQAMANRGGRH